MHCHTPTEHAIVCTCFHVCTWVHPHCPCSALSELACCVSYAMCSWLPLNSLRRFSDSRLWRPAPQYVIDIGVGTKPTAGWIWVLATLHSCHSFLTGKVPGNNPGLGLPGYRRGCGCYPAFTFGPSWPLQALPSYLLLWQMQPAGWPMGLHMSINRLLT